MADFVVPNAPIYDPERPHPGYNKDPNIINAWGHTHYPKWIDLPEGIDPENLPEGFEGREIEATKASKDNKSKYRILVNNPREEKRLNGNLTKGPEDLSEQEKKNKAEGW